MEHSDPRSLIRYALVGLALTVAISWVLFLAREALLLIYISMLAAMGLSPLVNAAEQRSAELSRRPPRWAAVLVVYLSIIGIVVGVGLMVIPPLVQQARELWKELPRLITNGQDWLLERGVLGPGVSIAEAITKSPLAGTDAVGTIFNAIWGFIGGLFGAVTIVILSFYMLVDSERIVRSFVGAFPRPERARAEDARRRITAKVSAWLGGQLFLAAVIGLTAALGLWLLGVPYFYVLALIAAIGEMVPVIGPLLAAVPAIGVAMSESWPLALGVAIFFFAQQQFENHLLVPRVMSRQVGVSPVIVITSLLIGGSLLGILGAILALPTAAIVQVLLEEWTVE